MSILIIAILATVAISQLKNFSLDARNSAIQANIALMRTSINIMNTMERMRCGKVSAAFPAVGTLRSNDISGCTNSPSPRSGLVAFVQDIVPKNPWQSDADPRGASDCRRLWHVKASLWQPFQ